ALTAVAAVAALTLTHTPPAGIARYAAYLALGVLLPGVLVYRALRGPARALIDDLAMGAATGFALELAAWALYSAAGLRAWIWTWPALVVASFALVPGLRKHWLASYEQRLPTAAAWGSAAVAILSTGYLALTYFAVNPLPPSAGRPVYYQDLLFHLALAGEAKHHFPLQTPQTAGEPLHYHWFADVHLAVASQLSGTELSTVLLRLWLLPVVLVSIGLVVAAGWRLSGRAAAGVIAAALIFAVGELDLFGRTQSLFGSVYDFTVWASPSMTYSYLTLIPLVALVGTALSAAPSRGTWALTGLFLAAATGAKASTIPVLIGGLTVVGAVLITRRTLTRTVAWLFAATILAQVAAAVVLFRGTSYGTTVDPLSAVTAMPLAHSVLAGRSGWHAAVLTGLLVVLWAVTLFARLAGIAALSPSRISRAQLFLAGCLAAGVAATLALGHPGLSQVYFLKTAWIPGALLAGWGMARLAAASPRAALLAAGASAAAATAVAVLAQAPSGSGGRALATAAAPAAILVVLGALAAALWFVLRGSRRGAGLVVAVAAVAAVGVPSFAVKYAPLARGVAAGRIPASSPTGTPAGQVLAARWIRDHSDPRDVVATDAHCRPGGTAGRCDARSFWVGAFTERRVLVEGWGYNARLQALGNTASHRYTEWPFWDAHKLAVNDAAFTAPTAPGLATLRGYGVRWLITDHPAAPALAALAPPRYQSGPVTVYELR
ncbi:MAG: hypothetical protein JWO79_1440, partial [Actinomycetia bacterium]|nr:hypothetical protein [Actinomycetes bacterium]